MATQTTPENVEDNSNCNKGTKTIIKISNDNDDYQSYTNQHPPQPNYFTQKITFGEDFLKRLREITLKRTPPLNFTKYDDGLQEWFNLSRYIDGNPAKRYIRFFYYNKRNCVEKEKSVGSKCYNSVILSAVVFSGHHVLMAVRERLSDQKWTQKNGFELPVKSKLGHCELQTVVSECLTEETQSLLEYIKFCNDCNVY